MQKYTSCTIDTRNYEAKLMQFFSLQRTFFQLPPANQVCEGYVFTSVCLSRVSAGVSVQGWSMSRGVSFQGLSVRRGLCPGQVSVQVGSLYTGGLCHGDPPITIMCRQYASYWNAFLFIDYFRKLNSANSVKTFKENSNGVFPK